MIRFLLLALAVGCSESKFIAGMDTGQSYGGAELDPESNQLRVDIYPSDATPELAPQSWVADTETDWGGLEIEVLPSIIVSGTVVGYKATPYGAEVPGAGAVPIDATVSITRPGTIGGGSTVTDSAGRFVLEVPPSRGYLVGVVPGDDASMPFFVERDVAFTQDTDLDTIDLGYGEPVYGVVHDDDDRPISQAQVGVIDPITGVSGRTTLTDARGRYLVRSPEGSFNLRVGATSGRTLPTVSLATTVVEDDGAEVDVNLGAILPVSVGGQVFDQDGRHEVKDVKVRFTSAQLADSDGHVTIETETDRNGLFNRNLLPGDWTVEFIPPYDSGLSPTQLPLVVRESSVQMDTVQLLERVRVNTVVRYADGSAAAGVVVNAREMGFDHFVYSATSGSQGRIQLEVPPVPLAFMLVPPQATHAVTHILVDPTNNIGGLSLVEGERVKGSVQSQGNAVPFALVEIRDANGSLFASAITNDAGEFEVRVEVVR